MRTRFKDVAALALIYTNRAIENTMIAYDKVIEYQKIINSNLDEMGSNIYATYYEDKEKIYFESIDENGKQYLVIDPRINITMAGIYYSECIPYDIIVAANMENALDILELQLINGCIIKKQVNDKDFDKKQKVKK